MLAQVVLQNISGLSQCLALVGSLLGSVFMLPQLTIERATSPLFPALSPALLCAL